MWLRCVCGLSLRAAMSSIIRRRSGLTVLVPLIGRSFLSEVERPSILRTGLPVAPSLSYRLATRPPGSHPRAAGRSGATSCVGASFPLRHRSLNRALRALRSTPERGDPALSGPRVEAPQEYRGDESMDEPGAVVTEIARSAGI